MSERPTRHRACPVCGGSDRRLLYRQRFDAFSTSSLLDGYDVVACDACGLCFADNIPDQAAFDRYWEHAQHVTKWTNAMLAPPPEHVLNHKFDGKNTMFSATEWHQDQGVATVEVDNTEMLTVWFPVFDATINNGCLCVIPESHKRGLLLHCPSKPGQVFDQRIPEVDRASNGMPV